MITDNLIFINFLVASGSVSVIKIIIIIIYYSAGQAKERPHLLVLAFPLYALAA